MTETENAVLASCDIDNCDGRALTLMFSFEGHGWGQGMDSGQCGGSHALALMIARVFDVFEVDRLSDLNNKRVVRVYREDGLIVRVGHPIKDKWFAPKEIWKEINEKGEQ